MRRNVSVGKGQHESIGVIHAADLSNEAVVGEFTNWLRSQKQADRTIRNRGRILRSLADFLHPTTLAAASFGQLLDWQNSVGSLDAGTVAGYVSGVRVFYRWLVRPMHLLDISPAEDLIVPRRPDHLPRPVPEKDFQWAVRTCGEPLMLTWLYLARYAGLRCCEIATLRRDGILDDPDTCRLHIVGKGGRQRRVPISAELREELAPWMRGQGHLFIAQNGRPYRAQYVSMLISQYFDSIDMPYTAHQLRHTFGTDAYERSHDIRSVQELMGHRTVSTTQKYVAVNSRNGVQLAVELGQDLRKLRRHPA